MAAIAIRSSIILLAEKFSVNMNHANENNFKTFAWKSEFS